jgi:hypothetical protein
MGWKRKRGWRAASLVLTVLIFLSPFGLACSWVQGYFHQVTAVRGEVVGRSLGPMQFRWLRQLFHVKDAELTLYSYPDAYGHPGKQPEPVARTRTDKNGWFDFGPVAKGHYTLVIRAGELSDVTDVEVNPAAPKTDYVKIDISPNFPDCTGGHEFIVRTKS